MRASQSVQNVQRSLEDRGVIAPPINEHGVSVEHPNLLHPLRIQSNDAVVLAAPSTHCQYGALCSFQKTVPIKPPISDSWTFVNRDPR